MYVFYKHSFLACFSLNVFLKSTKFYEVFYIVFSATWTSFICFYIFQKVHFNQAIVTTTTTTNIYTHIYIYQNVILFFPSWLC